jgi:hypothetical protein
MAIALLSVRLTFRPRRMIHNGKRRISVNYQNLAIDDYVKTPNHLALGDEPTQTIDLQSLLTSDVGQSGVFDLSDVGSTSFGKLLDALPVPVLLIDRWGSASPLSTSRAKSSASITKT